jgi:hypothetical protein
MLILKNPSGEPWPNFKICSAKEEENRFVWILWAEELIMVFIPFHLFLCCLKIVIFLFCWIQGQDETAATPVRRTTGRPEIAATPVRSLITPSKRSRSDTPATTPLRWGAQQRARSQQNVVVETSDQPSLPPTSPAVNLNPTSPLGVGEFRMCGYLALESIGGDWALLHYHIWTVLTWICLTPGYCISRLLTL